MARLPCRVLVPLFSRPVHLLQRKRPIPSHSTQLGRNLTTTSTSPFVYKLIEDVERLERYRPGGFHPIYIGDRLHERYRVVHKLGYGAFSTIWLARDERLSKYVAVKVCAADDAVQQEADTLARLDEADHHEGFGAGGRDLVPAVLDRFRIQGPNGSHVCLVTAPARCSLADAREASFVGLFQLDVARSLAAQLALAVAYIHEQGVVHGGEYSTFPFIRPSWLFLFSNPKSNSMRATKQEFTRFTMTDQPSLDLHLGNLLLRFPSALDNVSEEELYEIYRAPEPETVVREDGKPLEQGVPLHVIPPVWLGKPCEDVTPSEANLLLADFGVAFPTVNRAAISVLRAPRDPAARGPV